MRIYPRSNQETFKEMYNCAHQARTSDAEDNATYLVMSTRHYILKVQGAQGTVGAKHRIG